MVDILGYKRIFTLLIIAAICAVLAVAYTSHFKPETIRIQKELRGVDSRNTTLRKDIENMRVAFGQIEHQKQAYQNLTDKGFFDRQGRLNAERVLKNIQGRSGVIKALVKIQSGVVEENEDARKAGYNILSSPLKIEIEAMDDIDILRYFELLLKEFPGHLSVESINLSREGEINGTTLRAISNGQNVPLVKADFSLIWRTMIPGNDATLRRESELE